MGKQAGISSPEFLVLLGQAFLSSSRNFYVLFALPLTAALGRHVGGYGK